MGRYEVVRKGRTYVYESSSKRIKGKKNPVSSNVYLGIKDLETGELIPKKTRTTNVVRNNDVGMKDEYAKHYGSVVFLDAVQRTLCIEEDLEKSFGDLTPNILAAAMAQTMEPSVMDEVELTVEESMLREYLRLKGDLSPATMSGLTKEIGESMSMMDEFFKLRYARNTGEAYAIDITSISTYSLIAGWAEWGHNHDHENLEQTNWLLLTGKGGIPMSFAMLPGSVADITTLRIVVSTIKGAGLTGRALFDRGFESASNVAYVLENGVDFVTPSRSSEVVKKAITQSIEDVRAAKHQNFIDGRRYGHMTYDMGIALHDGKWRYVGTDDKLYPEALKLHAHVIYDPWSEARVRDTFQRTVESLSSELGGIKVSDAREILSKRRGEIQKALEIAEDTNGMARITVNDNSVTFTSNRAGMYVLLTPASIGWEEAVRSYGLRNEVEEAYDAYKNDIDGNMTRTPDPDRARGRFFIRMLSIMMIVYVRRAIRVYSDALPPAERKNDKVHLMTVRELLRSLNTVIAIGRPGRWRLSNITKKNRQIFDAFGIGEISTGSVVVKRLGTACTIKVPGSRAGSCSKTN